MSGSARMELPEVTGETSKGDRFGRWIVDEEHGAPTLVPEVLRGVGSGLSFQVYTQAHVLSRLSGLSVLLSVLHKSK